MRNIALSLLLLIPALAFGQNKVEIIKDSFPTYQVRVHIDGMTSKQIYSSVKEWTAINFKSANNGIKMDDQESGKIIIKAQSDYSYKRDITIENRLHTVVMSYVFYYDIIFDIKDNKFRFSIEITDVIENRNNTSEFDSMKNGINSYNKRIFDGISNFKSSLSDKIIKIKSNDNW